MIHLYKQVTTSVSINHTNNQSQQNKIPHNNKPTNQCTHTTYILARHAWHLVVGGASVPAPLPPICPNKLSEAALASSAPPTVRMAVLLPILLIAATDYPQTTRACTQPMHGVSSSSTPSLLITYCLPCAHTARAGKQ